jgi:hypothetical protein
MSIDNQGIAKSFTPVPQKSRDVDPVEGLKKYETIYYRCYVNNFKDDDVREKMEATKQQDNLLAFASKDGYDRKRIEADRDKVLKMREGDTLVKSKQGEIFEHIISENVENHNWLGDNAYTFKTVEHDDRIHHADLVVEWDPKEDEEKETEEKEEVEKEPVRLAIDCTVAEVEENLNQKVKYILDELKNKKMTDIDYFESQIDGSVGPIKNIPRVILAINKDKLEGLCKDFQVLSPSNPAWQRNYLQIFFLEEISMQLIKQIGIVKDGFAKPDNLYVKSREIDYIKKRDFLLDRMKEVLDIIENMLANKKKVLSEESLMQADKDVKQSKAIKHIKNAYESIPEKNKKVI